MELFLYLSTWIIWKKYFFMYVAERFYSIRIFDREQLLNVISESF